MLCLVLASTFWTLNSLNKTYYNVRVNYPIEFVYDPERLVAVTEPPKEVVINISGKGWKLLRKALNIRIRPAKIELPNRLGSKYLTSRQMRPYINAALSNLVLNYIVTDTVYFNFEPLVKRQVRLSLDTLHTFVSDGYKVDSAINIQPKSVMVSGPASLIKALPDPYPVHIPDSSITQRYEKQVPLSFMPADLVKSKTKQVKVVFKVNSIPFQETDAVVEFQGENPNVIPGGPPTIVKVRYQTETAAANTISNESFTVAADISKVNPQDTTVNLVVTQKPKTVNRVEVVPQKVKVRVKN